MKTNLNISNVDDIINVPQQQTGVDYLKEFALQAAKVLDVKYILIGKASESHKRVVETLVVVAGGEIAPNFSYNLEHTPCENVITGKRVCFHNENVAEQYPKDQLLVDMEVEAYIGAPIIQPDGSLFGLLAILDDKRIEDDPNLYTLLEFLASRTGAEIYRAQYEAKLINIKFELEQKVDEKTRALTKAYDQINSQKRLVELGRVSAGIAHEIKNPLNHLITSAVGIQNFFNTYKDEISKQLNEHEYIKEDLAEVIQLADISNEQSNRINDVVKTLLGQGTFNEKQELSEASLKDIITNIFNKKQPELTTAITMTVTSDNEAKCYINETALTHLFSNMVDNSVYALHKKNFTNGEAPSIQVSITDKGNDYTITFKDNGVGIPDNIQQDIFKPYFTTKQQDGTGLGLMVAQDIVKSHGGGNIQLNSEENEFTEFTFNISKGIAT